MWEITKIFASAAAFVIAAWGVVLALAVTGMAVHFVYLIATGH